MLRKQSLNYHLNHPAAPLHPLSNTGAILPSKTICNVGIDWLQVSFKGSLCSSCKYEVKRIDLETKIFKQVLSINYNGEVIATATAVPKSPILDPALLIIKMENKQLYVSDPVLLMMDIQKEFKLTFINITRIDLFRDFNTLKYGLTPQNLIYRFIKGEYQKRGKSEFKLFGSSNKTLEYSYLRFGGNTSDFQVYMYNKSKEMREVKNKPWIIERAKAMGVDTSQDFWRIEVSCKNSKKEIVNKNTGEILKPDLNYFTSRINASNYYYSLLDKYYDFRENTGLSKTARERKIELFNECENETIVINPKNAKESNRTAKMVLRHIENYNEMMRGESILGDLGRREFLENYIHVHALEDYYLNNVSLGYKLL